MSEDINTNEVALPVKGEFTPKRKFISFISGTRSGIRFVSNTAFLSLKELTGIFEEDVNLKFTICDEGTINIEEDGDTNLCTKEMFQRFINDIDNRDVTGYTQKYVVHGLNFKSEDGKPCFLEVDEKKPIDKLSSLLDDLKSEKKDLSNTGLSLLDSLFGESDESEVVEELSIEVEVEVPTIGTEVDAEPVRPSALELSFQRMNAEKIAELQKRIDKNLEEVKRLKHEISSKDKLVTEKSEEFSILKTRLKSLQPKPQPLGVYVFVSEENKTGITVDPALVTVVKTISPLLKLKEEAVIDLLTKGYFTITLGNNKEESFKLDRDILGKISAIDINGKFNVVADNQVEYRGDLTWHEILERLLQEGFEQDADFDKKSGSNSYQSEEEVAQPGTEDHCHDDSCGCDEAELLKPIVSSLEETDLPKGFVKSQVIYTQDKPGDLFFCDSMYMESEESLENLVEIKITDDETSIDLTNGKKNENIYGFGFVSICNREQITNFIKELRVTEDGIFHSSDENQWNDLSGWTDAIWVPNFVGNVEIVRTDGQPFQELDLNDYINHQVDYDDDCEFILQISSNLEMVKFELEKATAILRDIKLNEILKK